MKKLFCILAMALSVTAFAQKKTVVIGNVSANSGVSSQWTAVIRSSILQGVASTGRVEVVDGSTINGLSKDSGSAIGQLREVGASAYLEATIESISNSSEYKDGKTYYSTKTIYNYNVYDVATGALLYSEKPTHYGSSTKSSDDCVTSSFSLVDADMRSMVQSVFRVSAEIKAINETHPRKGIQSVYIGAGSSDGIVSGNYFDVFKVMEVAGEQITEKIASLRVSEVRSGTLSLCKVTKGGKELQKAMDNEIPVMVASRPAGLLEF